MAKILIIEDDTTFSQLLEGFLKKHEHSPLAVHDVKKSLKILELKISKCASKQSKKPQQNINKLTKQN